MPGHQTCVHNTGLMAACATDEPLPGPSRAPGPSPGPGPGPGPTPSQEAVAAPRADGIQAAEAAAQAVTGIDRHDTTTGTGVLTETGTGAMTETGDTTGTGAVSTIAETGTAAVRAQHLLASGKQTLRVASAVCSMCCRPRSSSVLLSLSLTCRQAVKEQASRAAGALQPARHSWAAPCRRRLVCRAQGGCEHLPVLEVW